MSAADFGAGKTLSLLAAIPLPGDARLSMRDLAEEVAAEYLLHPAQIEMGGRETRERQAARHHLWGAMRGAGIDFATIAEMWNVCPTRVRNGVILGSKRLGIEQPQGTTELGRSKKKRRAYSARAKRRAS